jgi:hypothetical protein
MYITQGNKQIQGNFYENANGIFASIEKSILKFTWNLRIFQLTKTILKQNKVWGLTFQIQNLYTATLDKYFIIQA